MVEREFLELQREVERYIEAGRPFDETENLINGAPGLTDDERASLWLWAWSHLPAHRQQFMALRYIESLEDDRFVLQIEDDNDEED